MGRWGSPRVKRSAREKSEQVLEEMLQKRQDHRGQDSVLFLLLSGSTQSMAGYNAKQVKERVRDSVEVIRRLRYRIADSDIWHTLATNIHTLPSSEEFVVLADELLADRYLANSTLKQVLKDCLGEHRLTPELLGKLNALRVFVQLPVLEWQDERLAKARARAEEAAGQ